MLEPIFKKNSFNRYFKNDLKIKFSCRNDGEIKCWVRCKICDEGEGAEVTSWKINRSMSKYLFPKTKIRKILNILL